MKNAKTLPISPNATLMHPTNNLLLNVHKSEDGRINESSIQKSPLGCATLLPVKYVQISDERKILKKSGQNFTGKSVAHVSTSSYYLGNTNGPAARLFQSVYLYDHFIV